MLRRLVPFVALLALACVPAAAIAKPAGKHRWTEYTRPATHEVVRDANVPIAMRDGTILRANVDRPATPGQYPVLVVQTPYNKDGVVNTALGGAFQYFAERGYVVVTADVRGTGASEGQWDSFGPLEQRDGYDTIEWAAAQPWSNGKVGGLGPSYMAITQLTTAAQHPPHLEAIFPVVPMGDGYRDIVFSGGDFNVSFIPLWLGLVTVGNLTPTPAPMTRSARCWRSSSMSPGRRTSPCRRSSPARPAATSPSTGPSGRPARRSSSSTRSRCPPSSSAASTTSSSAASR